MHVFKRLLQLQDVCLDMSVAAEHGAVDQLQVS